MVELQKEKSAIRFTISGMAMGLVLIAPTLLFATVYELLGGLFITGILYLYFWNNIELLFKRKIILNSNKKLSITFCGLKFSAQRERCFLEIADISFPTRMPSATYGLVLNRNQSFGIKRIIKNRVKLYVEDGIIDLENEMVKMSSALDIKFIPFDHEGSGFGSHRKMQEVKKIKKTTK